MNSTLWHRGHVAREDHPIVSGRQWWHVDHHLASRGVASTALRNSARWGGHQSHDGTLWLYHATPCTCACHSADRDEHVSHLAKLSRRAGPAREPADLLELLGAMA